MSWEQALARLPKADRRPRVWSRRTKPPPTLSLPSPSLLETFQYRSLSSGQGRLLVSGIVIDGAHRLTGVWIHWTLTGEIRLLAPRRSEPLDARPEQLLALPPVDSRDYEACQALAKALTHKAAELKRGEEAAKRGTGLDLFERWASMTEEWREDYPLADLLASAAAATSDSLHGPRRFFRKQTPYHSASELLLRVAGALGAIGPPMAPRPTPC